jgi:hypothetical protein
VLTVSLADVNKLASVKIADIRGAATAAHYLGDGRVDVTNLASGLYFVIVSDGQYEYRQKFTKE